MTVPFDATSSYTGCRYSQAGWAMPTTTFETHSLSLTKAAEMAAQ
ncbi:MAG TPA: hypothetical protein V6D14_19875 [Coleofasciculaceae cyanobacterium]